MSYCQRCGREAELRAGHDGGLYCNDCIQQVDRPQCADCDRCSQRYCGVKACPFCEHGTVRDAAIFKSEVERPVQPLAVEESCERCGGPMRRAFILHGKALCKNCLYHEQDRWEIVAAKPGKTGTMVKIVVEKPKPGNTEPGTRDRIPETEDPVGRKLFHSIGIDLENPPPDRFPDKGPAAESRMPDDQCKNCPAYEAGKMSGKFLGPSKDRDRK